MLDFLAEYYPKLAAAFFEHLWLVGSVMFLSLLLAGVLSIAAMYSGTLGEFLESLFSLLYAVPSLAMFALLIPVTGLGDKTAAIVLVLYNQYILLRNFLAGLRGVDPALVEAATGLGMTRFQVLYRVRLPLSLKAIFAGIRLAAVSTVGIATIAASINAGGLGAVLFDGLRTMNVYKIVWGALLSAVLALGVNYLFAWLENRVEVKIPKTPLTAPEN